MKVKIIIIVVGFTSIIGIISLTERAFPQFTLSKNFIESVSAIPGQYPVQEVVDGDTIKVLMDGQVETIRLIGIDTPETKKPNSPIECFGIAASEYMHKLLDGHNVRVEADPINTNRDRYDRLLRYVYSDDGTFVNAKIIEDGYGFAYLSFPFTKADEFRELQQTAREEGRGLWDGNCEITDQNGRLKTNQL